jgi:glycosyltransferase involved in cell wall biosynthesis
MKDVLIIIPAYNEQDNIKWVVDNLIKNYPQYDYIVINDGSKDHTRRICRENNFKLLDLPINLGLAGGFQAGMKYAYRAGYKYAIQFDADGQHRPEYIESIMKKMKEGYDIVIGSRFVDKKKPFSMRMLGSRLISAAIKITTGKKIKDPTSGMRMFNRSTMKECAMNINYGPEPDTVSFLMKNGAKVAEVQAEMDERIAGQSYLTAFKSISYMARMLTSILVIQNFRKRDKRYIEKVQ